MHILGFLFWLVVVTVLPVITFCKSIAIGKETLAEWRNRRQFLIIPEPKFTFKPATLGYPTSKGATTSKPSPGVNTPPGVGGSTTPPGGGMPTTANPRPTFAVATPKYTGLPINPTRQFQCIASVTISR